MKKQFANLIRTSMPDRGPMRVMALRSLINTFGNGLYMTVEVIYLTRKVGLSAHEVGLGFTLATAIALPISLPLGHLADRVRLRNYLIVMQLVIGVIASLYIFVDGFALFVSLTISIELFGTASQTMYMAYLTRLSGSGEERVRYRAVMRSATNLGIGLGTAFAGIALAADTKATYQVLIIINGITFAISGLVGFKLPNPNGASCVESAAVPEKGRLVALRDKRYVAATFLNGIYSIHFIIQNIGIPLWIVNYTHAPRWWVSVVLVINTAAVVLFSVRLSQGTGDIAYAAKAFRRAGFFVASGLLLYALANGASAVVASTWLVLGMILHVTGELLGSGAGWGLGFGLAQEESQGQYQGVWQLGWGLGGIIRPAFVTAMVVDLQRWGWVVMGLVMLITTYLFTPLTRSYRTPATV